MGEQAAGSAPDGPVVIDVPYLLALDLAVVQKPDGTLHADPLWARDLLRHLAYLPRFTLLTPVERRAEVPADHLPLDLGDARVVVYPAGAGWQHWLTSLPRVVPRLWREVGRARIVHTGLSGYPVPIGWMAVTFARLRRRRAIIIVESAFWRVPRGQPASRLRRLKAGAWEAINRTVMRHVDHAFYSHDQYRSSLPAKRALTSAMFQASWIDEAAIMPRDEAIERWSAREASGAMPRFLFAARMVEAKGTEILLATIDRLAERGAAVAIDVIGVGPRLAAFADKARSGWAAAHVRVLDPVPYGAPFSALLTDYDAVLVPSLSDEQPRIVYDAFAVGVGVIGSDQPGLRQCVTAERNGRLIAPGDPAVLADTITAVAADRALARAWGLAGLDDAARHTHDRMHEERAAVLKPFYPDHQP